MAADQSGPADDEARDDGAGGDDARPDGEVGNCPAIEVSDLTFRYPGADEPTLTGADLTVESGEFVAILGGNGSGKTTLCKAFNGIVPHFFEGDFDGQVTVAGRDTRDASVATLSRDVGYVFQEFDDQLVSPTVFEELTFAPVNYGLEDYRERAYETMAALDIEALEDRFVWELSGGQRHLLALGAALTMDPTVLVVDEPAAQLDPATARETYERLQWLNEERDVTVVAIEHHTEFVAEYCDAAALVADGAVEWKLPTEDGLNRLDDLRSQRIHPPQVTRVAEQVLDDGASLPTTVAAGVDRFESLADESAAVSEIHETSAPDDTPTDPGEGFSAGSRSGFESRSGDGSSGGSCDDSTGDSDDPVVSIRDVEYGYSSLRDGVVSILDGLSLDVAGGERVAVVGANGAGKSTLLRLVTGIERPDDGRVLTLGTDTSDVLPETLASDVVYVDQEPEEMFIKDSVRGDVAYYLRQRDYEDVEDRVDELIDALDLEELQHRDGRLLSVGEQRRASLCIGLATNPTIVLLDEPTGSLDLASRREVSRTVDRADDRVETVVIATHDLELVASWATRVVVIDDGGGVAADGPPRAVLSDADLLERCNLRRPQVVRISAALGLTPVALTVEELVERLDHGDARRTLRGIEG